VNWIILPYALQIKLGPSAVMDLLPINEALPCLTVVINVYSLNPLRPKDLWFWNDHFDWQYCRKCNSNEETLYIIRLREVHCLCLFKNIIDWTYKTPHRALQNCYKKMRPHLGFFRPYKVKPTKWWIQHQYHLSKEKRLIFISYEKITLFQPSIS
jgi:hypothetical protein